MSSSSTPERPGDEAARLALDEVEEAEAILEQKSPQAEAALGEGRGGGGKGGWLTAGLAAPGLLWIGFYLIAPLVDHHPRQLLDVDGRRLPSDWTSPNYSELFHDSTYWDNMLSTFVTSVIAVVACLVFGFPVAYFLALKVESLRNQIALFIIALAPFWTSFLTRCDRVDVPADGPRGRAQPGADQARHPSPSRSRTSASRRSRCAWR